jgi:hypothetical protein
MSEVTNQIPLSDIEQAMASIEKESGEATGKTPVKEANPLKDYVDIDQLKADVEFNPNELDNAVSSHASMFVHYANMARLAQRQYEKMKNAFSILESRLGQHHRDLLVAEAGSKKPTEAQIKESIITDRRWMAGANRLSDAHAIWSLARDAKAAFEQRKDMIIQLSVDRREERKGQLRIMDLKETANNTANARAAAVAAAGGAR